MFAPTRRQHVVFTAAYPFLQAFAKRRFSPAHPLATSPLWLDETDLVQVQQRALRAGQPSPLRLDRFAHHPELCRYSPAMQQLLQRAAANAAKKDGKKKKKKKKRTESKKSTLAVPQQEAPHPEGGEEKEKEAVTAPDTQDPAALAVVGLADPHTRQQQQQEAAHAAAVADEEGRVLEARRHLLQRMAPARLEQTKAYQLPICSATVYRHVHLYNADQMYILVEGDNASWAEDRRGRSDQDPHPYHTTPANKDDADVAHLASVLQLDNDAEARSFSSLSGGATPLQKGETFVSALMQEGVQLLRSRLPPPSSQGHFSIQSQKRFRSDPLQMQLEQLARQCGYISRWWGTAKQFLKLFNAHPRYTTSSSSPAAGAKHHTTRHPHGAGTAESDLLVEMPEVRIVEQAHITFLPGVTKLFHISLFLDAAYLLQNRCYISSKTGVLQVDITPSTQAQHGGGGGGLLDRTSNNALMLGDALSRSPSTASPFPYNHHHHNNSQTSYNNPSDTYSYASTSTQSFQDVIRENMKVHDFTIPLYFSGKQLKHFGLPVRIGFAGVVLSRFPHIFPHQPMTAAAFVNTSTPLALEAFSPSSSAAGAGDAGRNPNKGRGQRGLPVLGAPTIPPDPLQRYPATTTTYTYYYHLSQIHLPGPARLPAAVLAAELQQRPGTPLHGVTGVVLGHKELTAAELQQHAPELAAIIQSPRGSAADACAAHAAAGKGQAQLLELLNAAAATSAEPQEEETEKRRKDAEAAEEQNSSSASPAAPAPVLPLEAAKAADKITSLAALHAHVARFSAPTEVRGRNLWFTAEDVLQQNGIVDVNATPVEIAVVTRLRCGGAAEDGGAGQALQLTPEEVEQQMILRSLPPGQLFNVEALVNPEDGMRLVNSKFHFPVGGEKRW